MACMVNKKMKSLFFFIFLKLYVSKMSTGHLNFFSGVPAKDYQYDETSYNYEYDEDTNYDDDIPKPKVQLSSQKILQSRLIGSLFFTI
jgi:hypothetical protein